MSQDLFGTRLTNQLPALANNNLNSISLVNLLGGAQPVIPPNLYSFYSLYIYEHRNMVHMK